MNFIELGNNKLINIDKISYISLEEDPKDNLVFYYRIHLIVSDTQIIYLKYPNGSEELTELVSQLPENFLNIRGNTTGDFEFLLINLNHILLAEEHNDFIGGIEYILRLEGNNSIYVTSEEYDLVVEKL